MLVEHRAARCRVEIERLGVLDNLEYKGLLILEARVVAAVIKENQTYGYYLVIICHLTTTLGDLVMRLLEFW